MEKIISMNDIDDTQFDFSQWNFPEDRIWLHIPEWDIALKVCTFIPIILFGLFGNFIIVRLIILNRSLRTPTNLIIANMAVADFLNLLICPAMFMINDFYQNYQLGSVGCKLEGFLKASFLITAVLNLSAVSYDRLTAIVLPSETRLTMKAKKILIVFTWLAGFLIAMPLAIYRIYKFDFGQWNFPEDRIWWRIPKWDIALKVSTFVPIILFGLFGNFIIVRLIILNRSLCTPTNLIIANMAVADFLYLLICPPMFMINDFYQNYQLGSVGCKLEGFLEASFLITAVLNLSTVSYDRLTAIVLPSVTRLTMKATKIIIVLTWLAGFLIAMPLAIYRTYKVRQWKNFREMYCKENPNILPKYWYVLITVMVWFPLGVMLVCYSAIFYKLDRYEKRVLSREHPLAVNYKKTVAKTLFIVVIVFIVLRLPFTVLVILRDKIIANNENMVGGSFRILWYISQYLMFLNAAVNPLIYGFNNDNFRRAYVQTPLCNCCHDQVARGARTSVHNTSSTMPLAASSRFFNYLCCYFTCEKRNNETTIANCKHLTSAVKRSARKLSVASQRFNNKHAALYEKNLIVKNITGEEGHENKIDLGEGFI